MDVAANAAIGAVFQVLIAAGCHGIGDEFVVEEQHLSVIAGIHPLAECAVAGLRHIGQAENIVVIHAAVLWHLLRLFSRCLGFVARF